MGLFDLFKSKPGQPSGDLLRGDFATGSGMLALWDAGHFQGITNYETWEPELLEDEDITRHIQQGAFVPLNLHADGAYQCLLRAGTTGAPAAINEREKKYTLVLSEPYLFRSKGSIAISGLEHIERTPGKSAAVRPLTAGDWTVTVHLIDWTEEPGSKTPDGKPSPTALPDFLVLLNPARAGTVYRTKVDTFDKPGS